MLFYMAPATGNRITDPQRIRALAHPLRIDLLELLGQGEATATQCSAATGESVASCSFHLRMLAKYDFIEPGERRGREKPWRLVTRGRTITPDWDDPASVTAVQEFAALDIEREAQHLLAWIDRVTDEPTEWVDASTLSTSSVWATVDELDELSRTIESLTDRLKGRWEDPATRPPGARPVRLFAATSVDAPHQP